MRHALKSTSIVATLVATLVLSMAASARAQESNPAVEKFKQDMKSSVMNGSLTVAQVQELKENLEILKNAKAEQQPGAPIDLLTPYHAVSKMKATMASVKQPERGILMEDLHAVMATKKPPVSTEPDPPGKKLGKDIFTAVMHGEPTDAQVEQLQGSLNSLQALKASNDRPLVKLRTLNEAKAQISQTMNAGIFRAQDRQVVLDDLNNVGPQGGGMGRGR
ncbi:MAG: hypothetical protein WA700_10680 [Acidobacteriaceae bacterium]